MGKELLNWEMAAGSGKTLAVETAFGAGAGKDLDGLSEGSAYTDAVKAATESISMRKVSDLFLNLMAAYAPLVSRHQIKLKSKNHAVVLAQFNYMTPDIFALGR